MSLFLNFNRQNNAPRQIDIKNMNSKNTTVELSRKGVLKVQVQVIKEKVGNERTVTTTIKEKQLDNYLVRFNLLDKVRCFVADDTMTVRYPNNPRCRLCKNRKTSEDWIFIGNPEEIPVVVEEIGTPFL